MFVFLLPYVCACLWGHVGVDSDALKGDTKAGESWEGRILADMEWGVWELAPEEYVMYKLAEVMPDDYEPEALKAQAVLVRTELVRAWQEQGDTVLRVSGDGLETWYSADAESRRILDVYAEAVHGTAGLYLTYEGEAVQTPYFKVSNGHTRDAGEVWRADKYPYLQSVACEQDRAARDYRSETAVSRRKFLHEVQAHLGEEYPEEELWESMQFVRDGAGYVTEVLFDVGEESRRVDGETFRYLFDLPSASFEAERTDTQIIFHVTGVGHGFGMSQYAANCRAINGAAYDQILREFFHGTELTKIE